MALVGCFSGRLYHVFIFSYWELKGSKSPESHRFKLFWKIFSSQNCQGESGKRSLLQESDSNDSCAIQWISGLSVNSMVEKGQLEEILYGHCLNRCIHVMHKMRLKHPTIEILLSKFDIDSECTADWIMLHFS